MHMKSACGRVSLLRPTESEMFMADEGDGWHLTDHGREQRDSAKQRAEDLRTLIDANTL